MLLRTLFLLLLFSALAETIVHGAHALAQVTLRRAALQTLHREIESATTAAQGAIAAAIVGGADPRDLAPIAPPVAPTCILASQTGCALEGQATIAFDAVPSSAPAPCPNDACTIYAQENDRVDEGRIDVTIAAQATTGDGVVLAARTAHVGFRTLRVAPYAALAGSADASVGIPAAGAGDDAGAVPKGSAPGSLIEVIYENARTGKRMPANVWRAQAQRARSTTEGWSP